MRKRIQNEGLVWGHSFMGHDDLRIIHIHSVVQRQDSDNDSSHLYRSYSWKLRRCRCTINDFDRVDSDFLANLHESF